MHSQDASRKFSTFIITMKWIMLSLLVSLARIADAQVYPGLIIGYQGNSLKSRNQHTQQNGGGIRIGSFIDAPFNRLFGARMETAYSFMKLEDAGNSSFKLHYLSVPFSFFYMPHPQFQFHAGPQFNVLLNRTPPTMSSSAGVISFDRLDYGILGAMEFQFARQWVAAIRYYQGLNYNMEYSEQAAAGATTHKLNRISSIQLCLNYYLVRQKKE